MGEEGTLALLEQRAGVKLYVPRNPRGWVLTQAIGLPAATALCEAFGGDEVEVPSVKSWRVALYAARGLSQPQIAQRVGLSERTIRRILDRGHRGDARQASLFPL